MKNRIVIALAGNPNSGKTTLFNELTGARQHVGNYPGVTVERKEGFCNHGDYELQFVDLPGIYSLSAYSSEELIARNFIIKEKPDVVVDILDSSNLERNLYLAVQLSELKVPLVLVFNMSDMAKKRGFEFNLAKFSQFLNVRIVPTVAHKGEGLPQLCDAIVETFTDKPHRIKTAHISPSPLIDYGEVIEEELLTIQRLIDTEIKESELYNKRWLALNLLRKDKDLVDIVSPRLLEELDNRILHIEEISGESPETLIAGERYRFIAQVCNQSVHSTIDIKKTRSERIDSVVMNRVLGIPLFLGLMYLVFQLTFTLSELPMQWIEELFGWLGHTISNWWPAGSESFLKSLLVDGILGGVGGVIIFLPNILLLFLAIAILEDTGYMSRVAFIMDRLMHKIGLHGKSFIPMLIGFGCSVPALMATRTLENRRDRLTTMLIIPLMSCGARLPIYALIIPAFFPKQWHAPMLWLIYIIGIILAVMVAKLLRKTLLKGESVPFVMELPPYRIPTLKSVFIHMWERGWLYVKKSGTIILGISIIIWAMLTFPGLSTQDQNRFQKEIETIQVSALSESQKQERLTQLQHIKEVKALETSVAGRIGHLMTPVLKPMGFDWKIGTSLIGAFAAKEVFVAQMGIVYSVGYADEDSETLREKLRSTYSPLVGFCIMLFCLISAPCMATIAVMKRESNSIKWALFQLGGLTLLGYVVTMLVYQLGVFFKIGVL
jgi:ferrous iron transport protein B